MTLSTTTSRASFAGNGVTVNFSFPYYFIDEADLVVLSVDDTTGVETLKMLTTHYTIAGEGLQAGGTVTMLTAPATGTTLVVYRDPSRIQDLDLRENDTMPAEEVEKRLDKLTMLNQRVADLISRSVRLPDGFSASFDTQLPGILTPLYGIRVNAAGDGLDVVAPTSFDFDASVPTTTAGDLIAHNGTINDRLGVGAAADGYNLTIDAAQPQKMKWAPPAAKTLITGAKTANYTVLSTDDFLTGDSTGGAFTFTLPSAITNPGKTFQFKKISTDFNLITISGAETIDGFANRKLATKGESLKIVSDGAVWVILERVIPSVFTSYVPAFEDEAGIDTPTTGSIPTAGRWRRKGEMAEIEIYAEGGIGATDDGANAIALGIPSGMVMSPRFAAVGSFNPGSAGEAFLGSGIQYHTASSFLYKFDVFRSVLTPTTRVLASPNPSVVDGSGGYVQSGKQSGTYFGLGFAGFSSSDVLRIVFKVQIVGWEA